MRSDRLRPIALAFAVAAAGCVSDDVPMETRPLATRNPTTHEFALPLEALREKLIAGLSTDAQHQAPLFGRTKWEWSPAIFHVAETGLYPTWLPILEQPGNERDLVLHASDPIWESPVYRGPERGLPYLAQFHVHFAAAGPARTAVTVAARETRVLNGTSTGMIGHGRANRYVPVAPTSVEEYVVLRRIGAIAGDRTMPDPIVPER